MPDFYVGTSGWSYPHWKGRFFPDGLAARDQLRYVAERMDALEINATFYRSAKPETFAAWRAEVEDLEGFRFAVKGSRYLTHMLKLLRFEAPLANFFATGPLLLGDKLGPILWQLPPQLPLDGRLETFLAALPRTAGEAQALARRHDARFAGRASSDLGPGLDPETRLVHVVEPRHASFAGEAFAAICARAGVVPVVADTAGKHIALPLPTGPLAYVRLHGSTQLYASRYSDAELAAWADRLRDRTGEVWVFFDNDGRANAPHDAMRLRDLI